VTNTDEKIRSDELVPWLAFLAYEGETLSEGELAAALGIDRVSARDVVLRGADVARRIIEARVARIRSEVTDAQRLDGLTGQRPYGSGGESIRRLFADGQERTVGEVAAALGIGLDAATRRLMRSAEVRRVRRGVWGPKGGDR